MFLLRYLRHMELTQKSGRYLLYAIGEIILVVFGILIALQINNWNEGRKQEQERLELIENLKRDFSITQERLNQGLETAEELLDASLRYLKAAGSETTDLTVDEIRESIDVLMGALTFQPALGSYESAQSTGRIGLIKDPMLKDLFIDFERRLIVFQDLTRIHRELHFLGPRIELTKMLGSLRGTLTNAKRFQPLIFALTDEEFMSVISEKEVYATFEAYRNTRVSQRNNLNWLKEVTEEILASLEAL